MGRDACGSRYIRIDETRILRHEMKEIMNNFKTIECNNDSCDFWQAGICLYGGTATINPDMRNECSAYEPFNDEED